MKRLTLFIAALALSLLTACATPPVGDARQQTVDATTKSAATLNATITTARSAVQSGALKGQDAANVLKALEASLVSIKAAQASLAITPPAAPASGATK